MPFFCPQGDSCLVRCFCHSVLFLPASPQFGYGVVIESLVGWNFPVRLSQDRNYINTGVINVVKGYSEKAIFKQ